MKRSDELKILRKAKLDAMQAIVDGAKENGTARALTNEEKTNYANLKREADDLKTQIEDAIELETAQESARYTNGNENNGQNQRHIEAPHVQRKASKVYNIARAIRGFRSGRMDGLEAETQQELTRGINSDGLLIPSTPIFKDEANNSFSRANESNTTSQAAILESFVDPDVSIFGKKPLYDQMGCLILDGVVGSLKLNKKNPATGQQVAEEAALANNAEKVSTNDTLAPKRYGEKDVWSAETFAQTNPAVYAALIQDLLVGCDRKITADVYTHVLAAAGAGIATGALTEAGLNALMAAVDGDGSFLMARSTFFEGKAVKFDTGSGVRLLNAVKGQASGMGETWEGVPAFYSALFADGADQQYIAYGDMGKFIIARWGVVELLFDKYTLAENGQTRVIANRLADMGSRDDAAFAKSVDLNPA